MRRLRPRLTYANVVSTLCLFILLGGGAYAASKLPADSVGTKQLKKNAVNGSKVRDHTLTGADVVASTLGKVPRATHATNADRATNANQANHASTADSATSATSATNADQLGGFAASTFQSRVTGRCGQGGEGTTISKINPDGTVACVTPVIGIFDDTKSSISDSSLPYPFQFDVHCHDTSGTKVTFTSTDTQDGTLNWLYSDGASVSASGVALDAGDSRTHSIDFTGKRLEGQFILSNSVEQVTLNIHVLDNGAGNTCQGRGTAVYFSYGF